MHLIEPKIFRALHNFNPIFKAQLYIRFVFVQNKTTTLDVPTSTSKDEGVKEAPSLFDSLLSDTAKKLEKPQEEIKRTSNNTNALEKKENSLDNLDVTEKNNIEVSETKIEKNLNSEEPITSQDMVDNKAQKSLSLLDAFTTNRYS